MRLSFINSLFCLFLAFLAIALSSSATLENDDYVLGNLDWNDFDGYYPAHALNVRAAKSRFWKRAPRRHFWKRSVVEENREKMPTEAFVNDHEQAH